MKVSGGHMIKARVLDVDRKKITLDTGIKMAKIAVTDITPECILEQMPSADGTPRNPGEILAGDIVQVYLEHEETPEGDMLVSGQQAAVRRRVRAVWKELQDRMEDGKPVKGRILNSVAGGFSVGVAGLVCFLPNSVATRATTRKIGELQDFKVTQMNPSRTNVVLTDWRFNPNQHNNRNYGNSGGNMGRWRQQQPKQQRDVVREAAGLKEELEGKKQAAPAAAVRQAAPAATV
jgi:ribosomal protein S1